MPPTQIRGEQILDGSIDAADIDDALEKELTKVRVTSDDAAPDFLSTKIVAGANIALSVVGSSGSAQMLQVSSTGGGGSTPAGTDGQIQFNSSGSLSASSGLSYDNTSSTLSVTSASVGEVVIVGDSSLDTAELIYFADAGYLGSTLWPDGMGVLFSAGASEWDDFYRAFGGASIMGAITQAKMGGVIGGFQTFSSDFTVTSTMHFCGVSTAAAAVTASLASASTFSAGQIIIIKDTGRSAATNGIHIQASGSDTIDGEAFVNLTTSAASLTLVTDGVATWFATGR